MTNDEFIEYNKMHGNRFESLFQLEFLWHHTVSNHVREGMRIDKAIDFANKKYDLDF